MKDAFAAQENTVPTVACQGRTRDGVPCRRRANHALRHCVALRNGERFCASHGGRFPIYYQRDGGSDVVLVVFYDLETTPSPDLVRVHGSGDVCVDDMRVCELAAWMPCGLGDGGADDGEAFWSLVNPQVPIDPSVQAIHGIRDAEVRPAPAFPLVWQQWLAWMRTAFVAAAEARGLPPQPGHAWHDPPGCVLLVAHNGFWFDHAVLTYALRRAGMCLPEWIRFADTCYLAGWWLRTGRWEPNAAWHAPPASGPWSPGAGRIPEEPVTLSLEEGRTRRGPSLAKLREALLTEDEEHAWHGILVQRVQQTPQVRRQSRQTRVRLHLAHSALYDTLLLWRLWMLLLPQVHGTVEEGMQEMLRQHVYVLCCRGQLARDLPALSDAGDADLLPPKPTAKGRRAAATADEKKRRPWMAVGVAMTVAGIVGWLASPAARSPSPSVEESVEEVENEPSPSAVIPTATDAPPPSLWPSRFASELWWMLTP